MDGQQQQQQQPQQRHTRTNVALSTGEDERVLLLLREELMLYFDDVRDLQSSKKLPTHKEVREKKLIANVDDILTEASAVRVC